MPERLAAFSKKPRASAAGPIALLCARCTYLLSSACNIDSILEALPGLVVMQPLPWERALSWGGGAQVQRFLYNVLASRLKELQVRAL